MRSGKGQRKQQAERNENRDAKDNGTAADL